MILEETFADTLNRYVTRHAYTPGQLARLSGLPKSTIVNWLNGRVQQPRDWQPLVTLLATLHLRPGEADKILLAAGQPVLAVLQQLARTPEEQALLQVWQGAMAHQDISQTPAAPFQAPAALPFFVGREEIRSQLRRALFQGGLCTLEGMAGVGKSALAVRLAYELREAFPGGVLWARLSVSNSMSILSAFASAFGVDVTAQSDVDSRGSVVRGLLANRRVLIVLDDAQDSAGVETLLPPSGLGAVLVTTRRRNLRVAQRGSRFVLSPFTLESGASHELFAQYLGAERAQAETDTIAELAKALGGLPLALSIAAGRLAWEPGLSAQRFLQRLRSATQPLQPLHAEEVSVRQAFQSSFEALPLRTQHLFGALALFGHDDFDCHAAAATAGMKPSETREELQRLHSLSLLQATTPERYALHRLLQQFAAELPQDPGSGQRLLDYFMSLLVDRQSDDAALARDLPHIWRAVEGASHSGAVGVHVQLALNLTPFLLRQGQIQQAQQVLDTIAPAALEPDLRARYFLLRAQLARQQRHFQDAERFLEHAEEHDAGDVVFRATLLGESGTIAACQGDYEGARQRLAAAVATARENERLDLLVPLLKELGATLVALGHYDAAESCYQEARAYAQSLAPAYLPGLLRCLGSIAVLKRGDHNAAEALYEEALALAGEARAAQDTALILNNLAVVAWHKEKRELAATRLQAALQHASQMQLAPVISIVQGNIERLAREERLRTVFD